MKSTRHQGPFITIKEEIKPRGRIVCFPHAGGGASTFYSWIKDLADGVELAAVQLPGRETCFQEPLIENINELIPYLFKSYPYHDSVPTVFLGSSLGALIGFELCCYFRCHQVALPKVLVVCGSKSPHLPLTRPKISHLEDQDFIYKVLEYGGFPKEILENEELVSLFVPILRADFRLFEHYYYCDKELLPLDIVAFGGTDDHLCTEIDLLGWKQLTLGSFSYHTVLGGHFFLKEKYPEVLSRIYKYIPEVSR